MRGELPRITFGNYVRPGEADRYRGTRRPHGRSCSIQPCPGADVDALREVWKGPLILKGILHPEEAARRSEHGVDGVIVSNHGGRQLDGAAARSMRCPPSSRRSAGACRCCSTAACGAARDVLKALALGAAACLIGRPQLWGLAVAGEAGVAHVLDISAARSTAPWGCADCAASARSAPTSSSTGSNGCGRSNPTTSNPDTPMIEDPPLLQIRRRFSRPTDAEVDVFRGLQTGYVVDAMNGRGAMDGRIKPVAGSAPFCGVALTCHAGPADNLAVFGALSIAQRGDVIVCAADSFAETAVTGDLLLGMLAEPRRHRLRNRRLRPRCSRHRRRRPPVLCRGHTPNSPARNGPGTVGLPVVVGGVAVSAGDIVIGDQDGVVIVPGSLIVAAARRLPAIRAAEADLDAKVKAGLQVPGFIQDMIDAGRFSEID